MKAIKSIFILILMTTIVNLYPYTPEQFAYNIKNEYHNIHALACKCDRMDFKIGQKELEKILHFIRNGIRADAEENGDSSWPKQKIWNDNLFEKKDETGRTLNDIASANTPLCAYIRKELQKLKTEV